jgi:hypothetical protein
MATDLSITLSKSFVEAADGTVKLKVWVSSRGNAIPAEILLVHGLPVMPAQYGISDQEFTGVCSYADLVNYRTTRDAYRSFYRVSGVYREFDNKLLALQWFEALLVDVAKLQDDIVKFSAAVPDVFPYTFDTGYTLTVTERQPEGGHSCGMTVVLAHATQDPCIFVVRKTTATTETSSYQDAELVAVAGTADMATYGTSPVAGLYRTASLEFVFDDVDKLEEAHKAIVEDVRVALEILQTDFSPLTGTSALAAVESSTFVVLRGD